MKLKFCKKLSCSCNLQVARSVPLFSMFFSTCNLPESLELPYIHWSLTRDGNVSSNLIMCDVLPILQYCSVVSETISNTF